VQFLEAPEQEGAVRSHLNDDRLADRLVAGVIGWVIDAVPDWLAITLIAVGATGSAVRRRFAPATDSES
jgi:hypothetical protein